LPRHVQNHPDFEIGILRHPLGKSPEHLLLLIYSIANDDVGDSRAYLTDRNGPLRILTDGASKQRLGSGQAHPFTIALTQNPGDIVLLLSDGAWTPLNLYALQKTLVAAAIGHFAEAPAAILESAGKHGRAHDMTGVVLRSVSQ
jgi:serine/threonine protein phosphatase PrpC